MAASRGQGTLIIIVGPSGSGKDTLIDWLRQRLGTDRRVLFVKRTVTRQASKTSEDHASLSEEAFAEAENSGAFSVTWQAHGLSYGLPASLDKHLASGGLAIANGSRRALPDLRRYYPNLVVICLTVEEATLRQRLTSRGRESAGEIEARIDRLRDWEFSAGEAIQVDNSGSIDETGHRVLTLIAEQLKDRQADDVISAET